MKIAILSDFHLGYERFREDAYAQAERALNKAADVADALLIPGDIFDMRAPKPDVIAESINLFRNLSARKWNAHVVDFIGEGKHFTKVPIVAIPGTHERRAQDAADPVDILGLAGLLVDVSNATAVISLGNEKIAIRGIGGIADERFSEVVKNENPVPIGDAFNIFMFHESLYEMLPFNEQFMRIDELPKGFDLYVCGHIHNSIAAEAHGKKLLIPGSTVLTQLKEGEQGKKGFWLFDTKTYSSEFISIDTREFIMKRLDLGSVTDQTSLVDSVKKLVDQAIERKDGVPIVRIVLEGKNMRGLDIGLELNDIPRRYAGRAAVEISKLGAGLSEGSAKQDSQVAFGNMSVKDYGMGVFLEKIRGAGVDIGNIGPAELLDTLGSEPNKEKAVKKALDRLISD